MLFGLPKPLWREDGRARCRCTGETSVARFCVSGLCNHGRTEPEMMQPRTLPLTTTHGLAPRVAGPAYAAPRSGEVRPCIIPGSPILGESSFGTWKAAFGIEGKPGLHRLSGRFGRDLDGTTRNQRGCSGVVYAMV